jgi:N-acetyllactosaminide 3-alpha-galactosyltransferase/rhamnosyl/mannosyltransferase
MSSVTRNEGYGIALLEALRCGIPLCVNKIIGTGSAFIVKPGYNGEFFDINKEDSLLNSINKITNKENYEKYCDNALNDFNKRFSLENNKDYFYFLSRIKK